MKLKSLTGIEYTFDEDKVLRLATENLAHMIADAVTSTEGCRVVVVTHGPAKYPRMQRFSVVTPVGAVVNPKYTTLGHIEIVTAGGGGTIIHAQENE